MNLFDDQLDELLARGGTYDLNDTNALTTKQAWGFNASDGAVIATIKGIPLKSTASTYAQITAAEVDISSMVAKVLASGLFASVLYRVPGYIITKLQMTSGSLHLYLTKTQIMK